MKKIKKGELLVVSKALVVSEINKNEEDLKIEYDNPTQEEYEKTGQYLIYRYKKEIEEILSFKLSNYPEDYIEFLELYDGKNINLNLEKRKKESSINLKKIQDVIKFNSFHAFFQVNQFQMDYGIFLHFLIILVFQIVIILVLVIF